MIVVPLDTIESRYEVRFDHAAPFQFTIPVALAHHTRMRYGPKDWVDCLAAIEALERGVSSEQIPFSILRRIA